jgi:hypothetical protein
MPRSFLRILSTIVLLTTSNMSDAFAQADPSRPDKVNTQLERLLSPHAVVVDGTILQSGQGSQEIRLRLPGTLAVAQPSGTPALAQPAGRQQPASLTLLQRVTKGRPMARLRSLDLAPDTLLAVGVDAQKKLRSWAVIPDPRIIRAESPGPDGVLRGRILTVDQPEFSITIPNDSSIVEVRLFEPRWTGREFVLTHIARVEIQ